MWVGLGLVLAVTAYLLVNTTFMPYDDEGYVLISLRNYLAGLRLYDDVFSQYGPWPYVYHELITTALQAEMTHSLGRTITVFHWVAMVLLCSGVAWRLTRSQLAAAATAIITFGLTWQNTSEPSHPGSHISLLVALAALIVTYLPETRRPLAAYSGLGLITALLLLTKINVGLLLATGLGCFVLRHASWTENLRPAARLLGAAGLLVVPWVLLGRQLGLSSVLIFAVQCTLSALGLLWVTPAAQAGTALSKRAWIAAPLAAGIAGSLICLRICQHGTEPASLLQAVLVSPLRMPAKFMVGLNWYPEVWLLTAAGAVAVFKAGRELRRDGRLAVSTLWLVSVLRIIPCLAFAYYARAWPSYFGIFHFAAYCLPLLPVFVLPLEGGTDPRRLARWGVAFIAVLQVLHAFPVAGSQLAWATFLCVPVLVTGLFELRQVLPLLLPKPGRRLVQAGAIALALTVCGQLGLLGYTGWQRYTHSRPLDLPGTGDLRLDGGTRQALRLLSLNASIHADLLFSRQGMFSHNLWSGVPTPTAQNATQWFWLLEESRQREIAEKLKATTRTALINSHSIDRFMVDHQIPVAGPLNDFVQAHYRPLFEYRDFVFNVPRESRAAIFGRYELLAPKDDQASRTVLFRTCVLLDGRPAAIRLEELEYPWKSGPELLGSRSQAVAEPIDREGRAVGEPVALPTTRLLRGLYRLSVVCPALPPKLPWQDYALVVRDGYGRTLSESVY